MPSLTSHLLQLDAPSLSKATTHPFLTAAATGSLPTEKLKHWLAQDRLYALSYTNFIGNLLSQVSIPTTRNRENELNWRIADCLIECLINIRREVKLFEESATAEGLEICEDVQMERPTRCYQDLFAGALAQGRPLIVGLVVLWATEECYLRAWRFAKGNLRVKGKGEGDVMQRVFVPNWSSDEFGEFVECLKKLVDEKGQGIEEGEWVWRECEAAWKQVVWVEGESKRVLVSQTPRYLLRF